MLSHMTFLSDGNLRFIENELSCWIYLILLVPIVLSGSGIYFLIFKARGWTEQCQVLGVIVLGLLFAPIPWVIEATRSGYQVEFLRDQLLVGDRISDELESGSQISRNDSYAFSYNQLLAYIIFEEFKSDGEGRSHTDFTLQIITKTGLAIFLYKSSDIQEVKNILRDLKLKLNLPLARDLNDALKFARKIRVSGAHLDLRQHCSGPFLKIKSEYVSGNQTCVLRWRNRMHPLLYIGIGLPLVVLWFLGLRNIKNGFSWWVLLFFVLVFTMLLAFGFTILRTRDSQSVLRLDLHNIEYHLKPGFKLFEYHKVLEISKVRSIEASTNPAITSMVLYTKNPLGGDLRIESIWKNVMQMEGMVLHTDGLPVKDRMLLLELLILQSDW